MISLYNCALQSEKSYVLVKYSRTAFQTFFQWILLRAEFSQLYSSKSLSILVAGTELVQFSRQYIVMQHERNIDIHSTSVDQTTSLSSAVLRLKFLRVCVASLE